MLLDPANWPKAATLSSADFYLDAHARVFEAMAGLAEDEKPICRASLREELLERGTLERVGGEDFLELLDNSVPTAANVSYYAGLVREKAQQRRLVEFGQRLSGIATEAGKDVSEALAFAKRELLALEQSEEKSVNALASYWQTVTVENLTEDPPPVEYVAKTRIPRGKVTVLGATGGTGKTTWSSQVSVRRALGLADIDGTELSPGATVILTGEDGKLDYLRKFAALRIAMGAAWDPGAIAGKIHILDVSGVPGVEFVRSEFGNMVVSSIPKTLAELIKERAPGADLVFVETVSRFGVGEGNTEHAAIVKAAEVICRECGAAVVLLTHASQAAARSGETDQFMIRGGTALTDNSRSVLSMSKLTQENAERFAPGANLTDEEMDRLIVLRHPKSMGPRQPPVILELVENEQGAYFRLADLRVRGSGNKEALYEQLRNKVTLLGKADTVTARKLRAYHREFGLSEARMEQLVDQAMIDGVLRASDRVRGGGHRLVVAARQTTTGGLEDDE